MTIKLAFNTVACPHWPIEKVVEQAGAWGYQGLELRTLGPGSASLASDPVLTSAYKMRQILENGGIKPVCLSTSTALHHSKTTPAHHAIVQLKHDLELAATLGCPFVRIFGHEVEPGHNRQSVIQRIAERVRNIADHAGSLGVQILFENAGSFNHAKEWWWLFNLIEHPMVAMCWNVANAAAAGESAAVSVPNLHTRILLAKVKDLRVGQGDGFCPLGEGDVGIEQFLKRLLGIGFDGYVTVEWDRLWLTSLTPAQEYLPDAHQRLTAMLNTISELEAKGRKVMEKAAAKNAPKPQAELV